MKKRAPDRVLETLPVDTVIDGWLFDNLGNLQHDGAVLSVGLYCHHLANTQELNGDLDFDAEDAAAATGYHKGRVWAAMHELQEGAQCLLLRRPAPRGADGKFPDYRYAITYKDGKPLGDQYNKFGEPQTLRQMLYDAKVKYEEIPTYIMEHLRELKGKPLAIVLAGIREAAAQNAVVFDVQLRHWMEAAKVYKEHVMYSAWKNAALKKIMHASHKKRSRTAYAELFDPKKGTSLRGVWAAAEQRRREREVDNAPLPKKLMEVCTPEELVSWFRWKRPDAELQGDEWVVDCPECHGKAQGTRLPCPTLRFNFSIKAGVYSCHAHIKGRQHKSGKNDEVFCSYDTSRKMAYHFIAEQEHRTIGEVIREREGYIDALRAGKPYEPSKAINSSTQKEEAYDTI